MEPTAAAPAAGSIAEAAPATQTAVEAAVAKTPGEYRAAKRAERAGTPLAAVPVDAAKPGAAGADAPVENRKTRAEREQDRINESIRTAGESAAAPLKTRIAELEAQLQRQPAAETKRPVDAAPVAEAVPDKKTPDYKRIMALPGAPKLADFESVEEHAFAAAEFIDTTRTNERAAAARATQSHEARFAAEQAADDAFFAQLDAAKKTDPEFVKKLSPDVVGLTPVEWVPRDAQGRPLDKPGGTPIELGPLHVVASELRKSPVVRDLMLHFSQHPEELKKFAEMPAAVAALRDPHVRLRAHVQHIVREFNRLEGRFARPAGAAAVAADELEPKTISDAPDPAVVLGSRPVEPGDPLAKAIKSGNTRTYRELRRAERAKSGGR